MALHTCTEIPIYVTCGEATLHTFTSPDLLRIVWSDDLEVDFRLTSRIVIGASPILHAAIMESFRNDAGYPPKGTAMRKQPLALISGIMLPVVFVVIDDVRSYLGHDNTIR